MTNLLTELDGVYERAARRMALALDQNPELVLSVRKVDVVLLTHAGLHHAVARAERKIASAQRAQRERHRAGRPPVRYADVYGVTLVQGEEV